MKVVILAGGYGTRISEESHLRPKPMIEIGEKPLLWHIMKGYSYWGYNDFIICCGYKQHIIKEWFANYYLKNCDITFDFTKENTIQIHNNTSEPWRVTVVDTGLNTMTGGRIKRIQNYVKDETFMLTYGDGVSDVNIEELLKTHRESKAVATITAVKIEQRFGILEIGSDNSVTSFKEKLDVDEKRVNAGFMVLEPQVFDYIENDTTIFERQPLENMAQKGLVNAYKHNGFWQPMDTQREKEKLEQLWNTGKAPWKLW